MAHRHYNFPAMSSLVSFEAASRHRSFKNAASELNVTPGAVSHQVKALEEELSLKLFERGHRGVDLTEDGRLLAAALTSSFTNIAETVMRLREKGKERAIMVVSTTAFSSLWLTPRLSAFWNDHPDAPINQMVTDDPHRHTAHYDLLISYGEVTNSQKIQHRLFRDELVPLCAPDFAQRARVSTLEDLARQTLIHLDADDHNWTSWETWFHELGFTGPLNSSRRVNNYVIALQAAADGVGVVLGWRKLSAPLIEQGRLKPITKFKMAAPNRFRIVCAADTELPETARLLKDWLINSV